MRTVAAMLIFLRCERGFGDCFSRFRLSVTDPLEPLFLNLFNDAADPLRVIRFNDVEDKLFVIRLGVDVRDPLLLLHCLLAAVRFLLSSSTCLAMASIDDS